MVLSDWHSLQNGELLPSNELTSSKEKHQNDFSEGASNDMLVDNDEMAEVDSDFSDSDSDSEASGASCMALEAADTSNVLLGLRGSHLRYKVLPLSYITCPLLALHVY